MQRVHAASEHRHFRAEIHVDTRDGARADIESAYRSASIFCLSSRYEGFGVVLLEAMAYGLPVVSTHCEAGPKSLLEDGINALTTEVDSSDALAEALLRLMKCPTLQDALAEGGRRTANLHAVERIVGEWETLLHEVSGAR